MPGGALDKARDHPGIKVVEAKGSENKAGSGKKKPKKGSR